MIRGIAKPYAARVKDGSNTITTAVSQKIFIQKVIAALVGIALDFTAPSLLSGISSNATYFYLDAKKSPAKYLHFVTSHS